MNSFRKGRLAGHLERRKNKGGGGGFGFSNGENGDSDSKPDGGGFGSKPDGGGFRFSKQDADGDSKPDGGGFGSKPDGGGFGGYNRGGGFHSCSKQEANTLPLWSNSDELDLNYNVDDYDDMWTVMADIEHLDGTATATEEGFWIPTAQQPSPSLGFLSRTRTPSLFTRDQSRSLSKQLNDPRAFAMTLRFSGESFKLASEPLVEVELPPGAEPAVISAIFNNVQTESLPVTFTVDDAGVDPSQLFHACQPRHSTNGKTAAVAVTVGGLGTPERGCVVRVRFGCDPSLDRINHVSLRIVLRRGVNAPLYRLIGALSVIPAGAQHSESVDGRARLFAHLSHTLPQEVVLHILDFCVPRHCASTPTEKCSGLGFFKWKIPGVQSWKKTNGFIAAGAIKSLKLASYVSSGAPLLGSPGHQLKPPGNFIVFDEMPAPASPYAFRLKRARLSSLKMGPEYAVSRDVTLSVDFKDSNKDIDGVVRQTMSEALIDEAFAGYEILAGNSKGTSGSTLSAMTIPLPPEMAGPLLIVHNGSSLTVDVIQRRPDHTATDFMTVSGTAEIDGEVLVAATLGGLSWAWLMPKDPKEVSIVCQPSGYRGFAMRLLTPQCWRQWISGLASVPKSLIPGTPEAALVPSPPAFHALAGFDATGCSIGALSVTPLFNNGSRGPSISGAVGQSFAAAQVVQGRDVDELEGILVQLSELELEVDVDSDGASRFSLFGMHGFNPAAAICFTEFEHCEVNGGITLTQVGVKARMVSRNYTLSRGSIWEEDRGRSRFSAVRTEEKPPLMFADIMRFDHRSPVGDEVCPTTPAPPFAVEVWTDSVLPESNSNKLRIKSLSISFMGETGLGAAFSRMLS